MYMYYKKHIFQNMFTILVYIKQTTKKLIRNSGRLINLAVNFPAFSYLPRDIAAVAKFHHIVLSIHKSIYALESPITKLKLPEI